MRMMASPQVASLTKRDADIAIRATARPPGHLVGHHLGPAHFAIYGASVLFKGKRAPKSLEKYDWIAMDDAMPEERALTPELENCSADLWVLTHPDSRHLRRIAAVYSFIANTIRLD